MASAHNFFIEIRSVVGVTFVIANRLAVSAVLIMFIYNILINLWSIIESFNEHASEWVFDHTFKIESSIFDV